MMPPRLPLSGIRVLEFTLIWAGPYGAMLLSDMGAEVIRVESCQHHITNTRGVTAAPSKEVVPRLGSVGRLYTDLEPGDKPWNRHAVFNSVGRNRFAMTVDLRQPEGREIVHQLVRISDVIIDNNTVGMMDRFELDYSTLHALNPTLIYVSMPIFGVSGPYKDYVGFGANAEAVAGFSSLRGYPDSDPTSIGSSFHMDASSGIGAAYAALVGLYERDRTGRGQFIEFTQAEHLLHQIGGPLMDAAMNRRAHTGLGNRDSARAPQGIYPCQGEDRWIALSVGTDDEWAGLCQAIGRPKMTQYPAYDGNIARHARHDELDQLISRWTSTQDAREAMILLQRHGVPTGVVANDKDIYDDPHLEARGFFRWMEHPESGRHRYPGHPFKYSRTALRFDLPAPLLGQHNDLVYRQLLGLPANEIQRLTELGHIGDSYTEEAIKSG